MKQTKEHNMLTSMTGFIREEKQLDWARISIELRCVNSRYLDVTMRLPDEFRSLEFDLKKLLSKKVYRGKLGVNVQLNQVDNSGISFSYNKDSAKKLATTLHEIDRFIYNASPVKAIDILTWPGIMDSSLSMDDDKISDFINVFEIAIDNLQQVKQREGEVLAKLLLQRCEQLKQIIEQIDAGLDVVLLQHREKLEKRLSDSGLQQSLALDEKRLEQEVVLFVQKMDISEELDRLSTHINEVLRILNSENKTGAQGRRLDFLMQELNREANTIGSKSASATTSSLSVELKVQIEQMREQIQNIE
ncbi:MAG: YicC/YloC family endoribonuclease [Pseudomonadota bacterium]